VPKIPQGSRKGSLRHPVATVKAAATPLAVAGVVALSASAIGPTVAQAADPQLIQHRLVQEGFLAEDHVSGKFDTRTGAAVARWQAARGLEAHGVADATTVDVLLGNATDVPSPD
jgi:peptidoglycan hydrolase-like protein with peptidoglycan-binding domain